MTKSTARAQEALRTALRIYDAKSLEQTFKSLSGADSAMLSGIKAAILIALESLEE